MRILEKPIRRSVIGNYNRLKRQKPKSKKLHYQLDKDIDVTIENFIERKKRRLPNRDFGFVKYPSPLTSGLPELDLSLFWLTKEFEYNHTVQYLYSLFYSWNDKIDSILVTKIRTVFEVTVGLWTYRYVTSNPLPPN